MARTQAPPPTAVELPITPMLDMTFQLMVFFILTFRPQALEGHMDLNLPAAGARPAERAEAASPEPDLPADVSVIVKAARDGVADGAVTHLAVRLREGEVALADPAALEKHLARLHGGPGRPDALTVRADGRLRYAFVVEVVDACLRAGFTRVGFAAPGE